MLLSDVLQQLPLADVGETRGLPEPETGYAGAMTTTPSGWPCGADAEASILPWLADEVPLPPNPAPSENDPSPPQPAPDPEPPAPHPDEPRPAPIPPDEPGRPPLRRTSRRPTRGRAFAPSRAARVGRPPRKAGVASGRIRSRSTSVRNAAPKGDSSTLPRTDARRRSARGQQAISSTGPKSSSCSVIASSFVMRTSSTEATRSGTAATSSSVARANVASSTGPPPVGR